MKKNQTKAPCHPVIPTSILMLLLIASAILMPAHTYASAEDDMRVCMDSAVSRGGTDSGLMADCAARYKNVLQQEQKDKKAKQNSQQQIDATQKGIENSNQTLNSTWQPSSYPELPIPKCPDNARGMTSTEEAQHPGFGCICIDGYAPDSTGKYCVQGKAKDPQVLYCPIHSHLNTNGQCSCDQNFTLNVTMTSCIQTEPSFSSSSSAGTLSDPRGFLNFANIANVELHARYSTKVDCKKIATDIGYNKASIATMQNMQDRRDAGDSALAAKKIYGALDSFLTSQQAKQCKPTKSKTATKKKIKTSSPTKNE